MLVGTGFIEGVEGAVAADFLVADVNLDAGRINGDAAVTDGGQDAAPVGVGSRPCRFYKRGVRNGAGDLQGFLAVAGLLDGEMDDVLGAFAVADDLFR